MNIDMQTYDISGRKARNGCEEEVKNMKQLAFKRNLQVTRKTKVFSAFPNLSPATMLSVR
jgi:hypothetical protein